MTLSKWTWFAATPVVTLVASYLAFTIAKVSLAPFHFPSSGMGDGEALPSAPEYYVSYFLGSFISGMLWPLTAPYLRSTAAALVALITFFPCCFCTWINLEGPPKYVVDIMLFWMLIGCVLPILIYGILDIRSKRIPWL